MICCIFYDDERYYAYELFHQDVYVFIEFMRITFSKEGLADMIRGS